MPRASSAIPSLIEVRERVVLLVRAKEQQVATGAALSAMALSCRDFDGLEVGQRYMTGKSSSSHAICSPACMAGNSLALQGHMTQPGGLIHGFILDGQPLLSERVSIDGLAVQLIHYSLLS